MKKCLIGLLLTCSLVTLKAQTTWDEYRYINLYLKSAFERGSVKPGYKISSILENSRLTWGNDWRAVDVYYFTKKQTSTEKKSINVAIVFRCYDSWGNEDCIAIPSSNADKDMWDETLKRFNNGGEEWRSVFLWALSKVASKKLLL